MEVTRARQDDRQFVTALRNDPEVIRAGLSKRRAKRGWFRGSLPFMWIIEDGKQQVGYAIVAPVQEISIVLTKAARGRGLGTRVLRRLGQHYRRSHLMARIQGANSASLRAFAKAGFQELRGYRVVFR